MRLRERRSCIALGVSDAERTVLLPDNRDGHGARHRCHCCRLSYRHERTLTDDWEDSAEAALLERTWPLGLRGLISGVGGNGRAGGGAGGSRARRPMTAKSLTLIGAGDARGSLVASVRGVEGVLVRAGDG